ncbi:type I restriction enzyme S subunit [Naumannella cuiyingiana]|uniref:Type I restriction enzyme S subunit n=1 Tax=Naumannella cuiyingiana TaxID=1347891 RepID=A0A7Z0DB00_9ACTN|nr:type I restriction enzyme S subunit [Naumannella cuiyingiana]
MKTVELGSVATIDRKGVDPGTIPPETLYLGLEHIERGGRITGRDTVGRSELASTKFAFTEDHVLFGKLRPNLGKISRPGFAGVCSTDILPIRPGPDLDRNYLAHYLAQPSMVDFAASRTSGANLPRLSPTVLATFPITLPPLAEQRRIAAILDHADALRAKSRQVLDHVDSLARSIFHDMFGERAWPTEKLGDRLLFLTSGSRGWAKFYAADGDKFIRIQNVRSGYLDQRDMAFVSAPETAEARRTAVQPGDVLLSITADLGRTAVVPDGLGRAFINQHLAILRAPSVAPRYLADFLSSPAGQREILGKDRGATKAGLNFDDVRSVTLPIPPLKLQTDYAERVDRINAQRATVLAAIEAGEGLFNSLQVRAFRGEL